jgi:peptide/nickel transport system permease protein
MSAVTTPVRPPAEAERRQSRGVMRRLVKHRLGAVAFVVFVLLVLAVIAAPVIAGHDPNDVVLQQRNQPPSAAHWLGTDHLGRDVFARVLYGGRVSLSVGLAGISIAVTIGVVLGTISGFVGGRVDAALLKFSEIVISFPGFIIILTLVSLLGPNLFTVMAVLGLIQWTEIYRIVRNQLLALREQEFVLAARSLGAHWAALAFRHLLPNAMAPVIVAATLGTAGMILTEAGLSFLGVGVQVPTPSWGNMLTAAQNLTALVNYWWQWVPPGAAITLAVLCINFIGDALRDAQDPRQKI